jgi:glycosyltransferase involved in cell wall biosynthesis
MDFRFSILVPTRQRPDTLPATLATLVEQQGDDYEIVVADNFGDAEVDKVIKAAQQRHPRVKHIRSERVLPMAENWERGLAACSGEYVTVLGDDDGFLPSTLEEVRNLALVTNAKVIAWNVHTYWWPDTIAYWNRNKLYVPLGNNETGWLESRPVLVEAYRDVAAFGNLPMIYNGCVHRSVINSVIDRFGGYFVPSDMPPDVSSGIINLMHTGRYLYSARPLAVRGNSRRSTGTSFWARSLGKEQQSIYLNEEGKTIEQLIHPSLNASRNLGFAVASNKLHLKDLLFPDDNELQIDLIALVKYTVANLNYEPEAYEENLADVLQLADRIGVAIDADTIPKKAMRIRKASQGFYPNPGSTPVIAVDCNVANVFDVAGAARLAAAMSPEPKIKVERPVAEASIFKKAG